MRPDITKVVVAGGA